MTNFVIIIVDDLGFGDVGYHGGDIPTPIIDNLAISGTRLEYFYAQPVCTPSRAALLTGKYPFSYGMQSIVWPWNDYGLPLDLKIIPQLLLGYQSHIVGKWNLGHSKVEMLPTHRGFMDFFGNLTGCVDYFDHTYYNVHDLNEGEKPNYAQGHLTDLYAQRACQVIEHHDVSKPMFLYLAFNAPHLPYKAKQEYLDRFSHVADPNRRAYSALVNHLDDAIGTVVSALTAKGMYEDTVIFFTSDNGGWLGYGASNGDLKDGKISFFEGGIRVPAFFHYPPWNRGKSLMNAIHLVDVLPTFLRTAGYQIPPEMDGLDLTPVLSGQGVLPERDIIHFLKTDGDVHIGAMRAGDWKLMVHKQEGPQVFNVVADPSERTPVQNQQLIDALMPRFESRIAEYIPDPIGIYFSPSGPPSGFVFPDHWGPNTEFVKMLSASTIVPATWKEGLGYPADWEYPL